MRALVFCTVGGAAGAVAGFYLVDPYLSPPQKKMIFVSIYFSFAFALFLLNRYRNRKTFTAIPSVKVWKVGTVFIAETILDSDRSVCRRTFALAKCRWFSQLSIRIFTYERLWNFILFYDIVNIFHSR